MQSGSEKKIIRPLTGLRGVTIALVVVFHLANDGVFVLVPDRLAECIQFLAAIPIRMDLFFILGGFLISYVYIARDEVITVEAYRKFLWARFIHIYPGHLLILILLGIGVAASKVFNFQITGPYPLAAIPWQLTLTQSWPFLSWAQMTWNYPAWFLSALWFGYLVAFPWAWKLVPKLRGSRLAFVWVFAPLTVWLITRVCPQLAEFWTVIRVCCELVCGSALFVLYQDHSRFVAVAQKYLDGIMLGFLLLLLLRSQAPLAIHWLLILSLPLLVAGATAESSFAARFMTLAPIMWLGKISYSLFVSHALILRLFKIVLPAHHFAEGPFYLRMLILAAYAVVILGFAQAMEKLVVLPSVEVFHHLGAARPVQSRGAAIQAQAK